MGTDISWLDKYSMRKCTQINLCIFTSILVVAIIGVFFGFTYLFIKHHNRPVPVPPPFPCNETCCENVDLAACDVAPFDGIQSQTARKCKNYCENDFTCDFWSFDTKQKKCYLKNVCDTRGATATIVTTSQDLTDFGSGESCPPTPRCSGFELTEKQGITSGWQDCDL